MAQGIKLWSNKKPLYWYHGVCSFQRHVSVLSLFLLALFCKALYLPYSKNLLLQLLTMCMKKTG